MLLPLGSSGTDGLQRLLVLMAVLCAGWYAARITLAVMLVALARVRPPLQPWALRCAPAALRPLLGRAVIGGLLSAALGGTTAWGAVDIGCMPDAIPALDRADSCAIADTNAPSPDPGSATPGQSAPPTETPDVSTSQRYEVQSGDSLWRITAGLLPASTGADAIALAWPVLWEANRGTIGADPGLITPGTDLVVPAAMFQAVAP